jgi:hypothetical protein
MELITLHRAAGPNGVCRYRPTSAHDYNVCKFVW